MSKFQFKQFSIQQDQCAMKIGTDGVLLGAWAPIEHKPFSILDVGTGTGLIALMLAHRTEAHQIDALEIDESAYEQATDNFENSPWNNRLFCYHASLDEFVEDPEDKYDLIVSNPPFHIEDFKSNDEQRDLARFQEALPFENLIEAANLFLTENGVFAVIIPFKEETRFLAIAKYFQLYPLKITHVKGSPTKKYKRSLLALGRNKISDFPINELIIEISRNEYTPDYISLTKEFYLKM